MQDLHTKPFGQTSNKQSSSCGYCGGCGVIGDTCQCQPAKSEAVTA